MRAKFLAMALGGVKTKNTTIRKIKDRDGNLTEKEEVQIVEGELARIYKHSLFGCTIMMKIGGKVERKQDEDADIPTDIEHGINIDSG